MAAMAAIPPEVPREAFYAAFPAGDLVTIQAFLAQPSICTEVDETERYIATHKPPNACFIPAGTLGCPWYFQPTSTRSGSRMRRSLLAVAAYSGHTHVIAWFFSGDRIASMGATLAIQLSTVATYDSNRTYFTGTWRRDIAMLEILLASSVFCDFLTPAQQQRVLDEVATGSQSPHMVALAVAHGARLDTTDAVQTIAQFVKVPRVVDVIVRDGAFVIGAADVLAVAAEKSNVCGVSSFLRHGADWGNNAEQKPLVVAAQQMSPFEKVVRALLTHGFLDVDARGTDGVTALMVAAWNQGLCPGIYPDTPSVMVKELLHVGADVHAVDTSGTSALDYAVRSGSSAVARLLRARGAVEVHEIPTAKSTGT